MLDFGYYNMDCMQGMKEFPDNYFDLAIVDPPYGNGNENYDAKTQRYGGIFSRYFQDNKKDVKRTGGSWSAKYGKNINEWDVAPSEDYFAELFRVSKNQIIWGGITSIFHRQDVLSFGRNLLSVRVFQWQWLNMLGHHLMTMQKFSSLLHKVQKNLKGFIRLKSQLRCMNGF